MRLLLLLVLLAAPTAHASPTKARTRGAGLMRGARMMLYGARPTAKGIPLGSWRNRRFVLDARTGGRVSPGFTDIVEKGGHLIGYHESSDPFGQDFYKLLHPTTKQPVGPAFKSLRVVAG